MEEARKNQKLKSSDVKEIYSKEYFLYNVDGFKDFNKFNGDYDDLFSRYKENIKLLNLRVSDKFLEIGCGRGEIVMYHGKNGGYGLGVDFSADAIALAVEKAKQLNINCDFMVTSFEDIPEKEKFDKILASEFIEHISEYEGLLFIKKCYNLLKENGVLVIYTYPNTLQRKVGYKFIRYKSLFTSNPFPKIQDDMKDEHYKKYHLNEQSYFRLKKLLHRYPFRVIDVFYEDNNANFNPKSKILNKLFLSTPMKHLFLTGLTAVVVK